MQYRAVVRFVLHVVALLEILMPLNDIRIATVCLAAGIVFVASIIAIDSCQAVTPDDVHSFGRTFDTRVQSGNSASPSPTVGPSPTLRPESINADSVYTFDNPSDTRVNVYRFTGAITSVSNRRGELTRPSSETDETIVRGFLGRHSDLFGMSASERGDLFVLGDSAGGASGLRMLRMEQRVHGVPIFQGEIRFLLDRAGRLVKIVGMLLPHAYSRTISVTKVNSAGLSSAIRSLLANEGRRVEELSISPAVAKHNGWAEVVASDPWILGPVSTRQVLFPLTRNSLVPAWELVAFTRGDEDLCAVIVDSGKLLWRKNIRAEASAQDARFRVYVQADGTTPFDSPAPASPSPAVPASGMQFTEILPSIVSMHAAMDSNASPNGWIDDCVGPCTDEQTQTLGNNVLACLDRVADDVCDTDVTGVLDGNGRPKGNPDASGRERDFFGVSPRDFQTYFLPPPIR